MDMPARIAAPPASLTRRFELATSAVTIAGPHYELLKPRSVDDLISEEDFAIDERIPYWADCWPSARCSQRGSRNLPDRTARCWNWAAAVGLVSLVAAAGGHHVLATDYYRDALEFTAANAQRHGLEHVDTRLVDWRHLPDDLGTFDVVVASDVLYDGPMAALRGHGVRAGLGPWGFGLLSDPGRRTAESFVDACQKQGLAVSRIEKVPTDDAGTKLTVSIYEIRRG